MRKIVPTFLCLILMACNTKPPKSDTAKPLVVAKSYAGAFDLAKLTLTENLPAVMAAEDIKPESKDSTDLTMLGFEVFKSTSPKVLRFENADMWGTNGKNKNHVLFHYDEKKNTLAGYELWLYNQIQTNRLIALLGKIGKLTFKRTKLPKGAIELDVNGDEVKPENSERKTFRVWENKNTGLSYFLSESGSGKSLITNLVVLNKNTQFGKDWIELLQLNSYRYDKSEPLQ